MPRRRNASPVRDPCAVTSEERNVLIFLAVGLVLGSWPWGRDGHREEPAAANGTGSGSREAVVADLFPIDLNRASADLLTELPGIGPAKARDIVERRSTVGPYRTVEDLAKVRGIGTKTVDRLRDRVTVSEPGTLERENEALGERPARGAPHGERGRQRDADGAGEEPGQVER
ncbi:helix-hairpin-helix domain-containing protein [bacterium]|nr:helix-hairpin-helix domain-containing protein [bacterium]